jgi:hypothetical protein
MFFFEKKNQKTFVTSRCWSGQTVATQKPGTIESFFASPGGAPFFAKKEVLPSDFLIPSGDV